MPNNLVLPGDLTYEMVPKEEKDRIKKDFPAFVAFKDMLRVGPSKTLLFPPYLDVAHLLYNFKFEPTDVVVMAPIKSGTTWLEEIVWTMRHNSNLNNPEASEPINERSPYMELDVVDTTSVKADPANRKWDPDPKFCSNGELPVDFHLGKNVNARREKRQIKTHYPFSLHSPSMLDTCKVISIRRNPRDVIQSAYNYLRTESVSDFSGNFECMVDAYINNRVPYGPYWGLIGEIWEKKDHPNIHILTYEELSEDPKRELKKLDKFLGTNLSEEQIENIIEYCSFKNMKKRDEGSKFPLWSQYIKDNLKEEEKGFFKKGKVGTWKKYPLSNEMEKKLAKWITENEEKIGITFRYE